MIINTFVICQMILVLYVHPITGYWIDEWDIWVGHKLIYMTDHEAMEFSRRVACKYHDFDLHLKTFPEDFEWVWDVALYYKEKEKKYIIKDVKIYIKDLSQKDSNWELFSDS